MYVGVYAISLLNLTTKMDNISNDLKVRNLSVENQGYIFLKLGTVL